MPIGIVKILSFHYEKSNITKYKTKVDELQGLDYIDLYLLGPIEVRSGSRLEENKLNSDHEDVIVSLLLANI